jgi:hypothetical protein
MVAAKFTATVLTPTIQRFKEAPMEVNYSQVAHAQLCQRYQSGVKWFYWIAGLSLISSIISMSGGRWGFLITLAATQFIDGFAQALAAELGGAVNVVGLVLDVLVTGVFVGFGLLAAKKFLWAYMLGMVIFLLDGLVLLLFQDFLGAAFHGLVLYWMFGGFQAGQKLVALEKEMAQSAQAPPQPELV